MTYELDRFFRNGILRIDKSEWLQAFINARGPTFTRKNVLSGWVGTGLRPFNLQKVLGRIPIPSPPEDIALPQESTPEFSSPLQHPNLNSSPLKTLPFRAASSHIKKCALDRTTAFDTPTRNQVVRMTRTLDRSLAKNRILTKQLSELQNIVTTRKQRQTGKHAILRGQTIIATLANWERIQTAEAATKSRTSKKQKVNHTEAQAPQPTAPPINIEPEDSNSEDDLNS